MSVVPPATFVTASASQNGTIVIYTGGQNGTAQFEVPLVFDSQWEVFAVAFQFSANQNFQPSPLSAGTASFQTTMTYAGKSVQNQVAWNSLNFSDPLQTDPNNPATIFLSNQGQVGTGYHVSGQNAVFNMTYNVPETVVTAVTCGFNVTMQIIYAALVANPTSTPNLAPQPTPVITPNKPPSPTLPLAALAVAGGLILLLLLSSPEASGGTTIIEAGARGTRRAIRR